MKMKQSEKKSRISARIRPSTTVYWFRFGLGGIVAVLLMVLKANGSTGIWIAIFAYFISYLIVRRILKFGETELKGKYKTVTLGIGTYIFTWALVWILLFTLYPYVI